MTTTINLVTTCHHVKILHYYWPYSPHCTFHTWDIYLVTRSLSLLISFTYFSHPPCSLPSSNHPFVLCDSVPVLLCLFICFCFVFFRFYIKGNHTVFFFLWLFSLSIIPSRSVCTCSVAQSHLSLCDPMDRSPPGSSVHEISQERILHWVAISCFRRSSQPRDQTCVSGIGRQVL